MPFRRVVDAQAGPGALGILVPPGMRTTVILRPRACLWDLLPAQGPGDSATRLLFCDFPREAAAAMARKVQYALERMALMGRQSLEVIARTNSAGFEIWGSIGELSWVVCPREPGRPYQPSLFPGRDDAQSTLLSLAATLFPSPDRDQEYYFNTQNFTGSLDIPASGGRKSPDTSRN